MFGTEVDTEKVNLAIERSKKEKDKAEDIDINIPDGDYETVAGFILQQIGKMPQTGDHFEYLNLCFEVAEMKGLKLETVKVTKKSYPHITPQQESNT